ncbi:hypothetical protein AVEN_4580-1 [Araneus ventricosus]|uniref:Uncharacterized protein n=1 Tax=Araneus ventricosus TaxID=182803 RepID=A0A4Y2QGD2_ARAVE|nr:hypothetical protein AVEN_4580-1 [Araneus ventricosus]
MEIPGQHNVPMLHQPSYTPGFSQRRRHAECDGPATRRRHCLKICTPELISTVVETLEKVCGRPSWIIGILDWCRVLKTVLGQNEDGHCNLHLSSEEKDEPLSPSEYFRITLSEFGLTYGDRFSTEKSFILNLWLSGP